MAERTWRIVVPKYDNSGRRIDISKIEDILKDILDRFKGYTVFPDTYGCYKLERDVEEDGKIKKITEILCEPSFTIWIARDLEELESVCENLGISECTEEAVIKSDDKFIRDVSKDIAETLGQYSVMQVETPGEVEFVKGEYKERLEEEMIEKHPTLKEVIW